MFSEYCALCLSVLIWYAVAICFIVELLVGTYPLPIHDRELCESLQRLNSKFEVAMDLSRLRQ